MLNKQSYCQHTPNKSNVWEEFEVQHDRKSISFLANKLIRRIATITTSSNHNFLSSLVYISFINKNTSQDSAHDMTNVQHFM